MLSIHMSVRSASYVHVSWISLFVNLFRSSESRIISGDWRILWNGNNSYCIKSSLPIANTTQTWNIVKVIPAEHNTMQEERKYTPTRQRSSKHCSRPQSMKFPFRLGSEINAISSWNCVVVDFRHSFSETGAERSKFRQQRWMQTFTSFHAKPLKYVSDRIDYGE